MPKYLNSDLLYDRIQNYIYDPRVRVPSVPDIIDIISQVEEEDSIEVAHGTWKKIQFGVGECSVCGEHSLDAIHLKVCPYCNSFMTLSKESYPW